MGEVMAKLTEEQIWACNNTEEDGGVHICLEHQNVVDFARSIEREIGFAKAELWIKRINDAVAEEREACAKLAETTVCDIHLPTGTKIYGSRVATAIRAKGTA